MTSNYFSSSIVYMQVVRMFNCIVFIQHLSVYVKLSCMVCVDRWELCGD